MTCFGIGVYLHSLSFPLPVCSSLNSLYFTCSFFITSSLTPSSSSGPPSLPLLPPPILPHPSHQFPPFPISPPSSSITPPSYISPPSSFISSPSSSISPPSSFLPTPPTPSTMTASDRGVELWSVNLGQEPTDSTRIYGEL